MYEIYCKSCRHFTQHYALCNGRLIQVYCGHCIYAAPKAKRPDRRACEHFEQGIKDTESFVNKEYLSKKLLEKVMSMELLPEVKELPI